MKYGMTIYYSKCKADLNFDVDLRVIGVIGTTATKWDLILFGKLIVFIHNINIFSTSLNSSTHDG